MTTASSDRFRQDLGQLEASATRAGLALACCYSSAAEFEADVIRERRAAGAFGHPLVARLRVMLALAVATCVAALLARFS